MPSTKRLPEPHGDARAPIWAEMQPDERSAPEKDGVPSDGLQEQFVKPFTTKSERLKVKRILFRGGYGMGDSIVCEPILSAVRAEFPHADLDLHLPELARPLGKLGLPGNVLPEYPERNEALSTFAPYDFVIDTDPGVYDHPFFEQLDSGTRLVRVFAHYRPKRRAYPAYVRVQEAIRRLGLRCPERPPELRHDPRAQRQVSDWLDGIRFKQGEQPMFLIQPGSGWPHKRWQPESFAAVADSLIDRYPKSVVILITGPWDGDLCKVVRGSMRHSDKVRTITDWSLARIAALCEKASMFIGNDAGLTQFAAAYQTPITVICGPTFGSVWAPATDRALLQIPPQQCCRKPWECDKRCLRAIRPHEVNWAIEALLTELTAREMRPLDPIRLSGKLIIQDSVIGTILLSSKGCKDRMNVKRGAGFILEFLHAIEGARSSSRVLNEFPGTRSLLAQLMRHGIVEPDPGFIDVRHPNRKEA